jgi:hypothetical protein
MKRRLSFALVLTLALSAATLAMVIVTGVKVLAPTLPTADSPGDARPTATDHQRASPAEPPTPASTANATPTDHQPLSPKAEAAVATASDVEASDDEARSPPGPPRPSLPPPRQAPPRRPGQRSNHANRAPIVVPRSVGEWGT